MGKMENERSRRRREKRRHVEWIEPLEDRRLLSGAWEMPASFEYPAPETPAAEAGLRQATVTTIELPATATYGDPISIVAQVSSSAGVPTGLVYFAEGPTTIGSAPLDAEGRAVFTPVTPISGGVHGIRAVYSSDDSFLSSSSPIAPIEVAKVTATVRMTVSPQPLQFGQQATVTASVTWAGGAATGGRVDFYIGGVGWLGSSSVDGAGVATATFQALSGGTRNLIAQYAGASSFHNTSASIPLTIEPGTLTLDLHAEPASPPVQMLPMSGHRDLILDSTRGHLLIVMDSGQVQRYDIATRQFLASWPVGTSPRRGDITADGAFLYLTDAPTAGGQGVIHRLDLETGAVTDLFYPLIAGETGGWDIAIASDGIALFNGSSDSLESAPLRRIDLATGAISVNPPVGPHGEDEMWSWSTACSSIFRGADRSLIAFSGSGGMHRVLAYDARTHAFVFSHNLSGSHGLHASISADGSRIGFWGNDLNGHGSNLMAMGSRTLDSARLTGVEAGIPLLDPAGGLLWIATKSNPRIAGYDITTGYRVRELPLMEPLNSPVRGRPTSQPVLFTDDGSFLFLATPSGVQVTDLNAQGVAQAGVPVTFRASMTNSAGTPVSPNGRVEFFDAVTGVLLASRSVTYTYVDWVATDLPLGTMRVTARLAGDVNWTTIPAAAEVVVSQAPTAVTLSTTTNLAYGGPLELDVTVRGPGRQPSGFITLMEGSTVLGRQQFTGASAGFNVVRFTVNPAVGAHAYRAVFEGDDLFAPSSSATLEVLVPVATQTTLTSSNAQAIVGQPVTLTARVQAVDPANPTPTGTVRFTHLGADVGVVDLVDGAATLTLDNLQIGYHDITAYYMGSPGLLQSQAWMPQEILETLVVDLMVVYTPMVANQFSLGGYGMIEQSVRDTNIALRNSQAGFSIRLVHKAMVQYFEGGDFYTHLAHLTNPADGVMDEVHAWRDQYGADLVSLFVGQGTLSGLANQLRDPAAANRADKAFTIVLARDAAAPQYTLAHELGHNFGAGHDIELNEGPGLLPYSYGHRFTATDSQWPWKKAIYRDLMAYEPGIIIPYFSNPDVIFKGVPTGVAGQAENALTMRRTAPIVAAYRGGRPAGYAAESAVLLSSSSMPAGLLGQDITFIANVRGLLGVTGVPTGSVIFWAGAVRLGEVPLDAEGNATLSTAGLELGTHWIVAEYAGDSAHLAGVSTILYQQVASVASQVTLTSANPIAAAGFSVTFTATVTSSAPVTGTVEFWEGDVFWASMPVNALGQAVLHFPLLSAGTHVITARYTGTLDVAASESAPLLQVAIATALPKGKVSTKGGMLSGWVTDGDAKGKPINAYIYIDNTLRRRITLRAGKSNRYTLSWTLPSLGLGAHRVELYITDRPSGQRFLVSAIPLMSGQDLFDAKYYLRRYADVRRTAQGSLSAQYAYAYEHYLTIGQFQRRNPSASFDEKTYLATYKDVLKLVKAKKYSSGFEHYVMVGRKQGREGLIAKAQRR